MDIPSRLNALGLALPPVPKPQGSYVPSVRSGNLVFVAGQLPIRDGKLTCSGKVGQEVSLEDARAAARLCFLNALAALAFSVDPARVTRVVRLGGFVQSAEGFFQQPMVLNGASELAQEIFGEAGTHARAAVGVNALPLNAAVEVEAVFEIAPEPASASGAAAAG
jgi:enamine deaminase RidA (YjgF/YER057c/UK114 family)